jgi:hypothetical protein
MTPPLEHLIQLTTERLAKKTRRAEDAYVRQHTAPFTLNCRHRGPALGDRIHACKLQCQGANEQEAGTCHDRKAAACAEFTPRLSSQQLHDEFRHIPPEELSLRWPAIGELRWLLAQMQAQPNPQPAENATPAA